MTQPTDSVSSNIRRPSAADVIAVSPQPVVVEAPVSAKPVVTMQRASGAQQVDSVAAVAIGKPSLPEGSWEGTSPQVIGRKDRMVMQFKRDPQNPQGYYASLSEYSRRLPAWLGQLAPGLQMTSWVPRMYPYYITHKGNDVYEVRPMHVGANGDIEPNPNAKASTLKLSPNGMKGAELTRCDKDGKEEKISFHGGKAVTTWEKNIVGKYFLAIDRSGGEYFEKGVNAEVTKAGVLTLDTHHLGGSYKVKPQAGGLFFTLEPMAPHQLGANAAKKFIGKGMDIVNWKPFRTTIEILLMNPENPRDVKFFYERHNRDPKFSIKNLFLLLTRRLRGEPPMTREQLPPSFQGE